MYINTSSLGFPLNAFYFNNVNQYNYNTTVNSQLNHLNSNTIISNKIFSKKSLYKKNINDIITIFLFDEVEKVFYKVFDQKVPQSEHKIFLQKLFVIMNNHVEDLVDQINASAYNEPNVQFIPGISSFFPSIFNSIQNSMNQYSILSNPSQIQNIYQQNFSERDQFHSLKNQRIERKNRKKIIKQKIKIKKQIENQNLNSVELFNKSSLEKQQSIIFNIIKKNPNCESITILSNINDFLLYLLRFNPKSNENYFSISSKNEENSIEEGCKNLIQIQLSHSAIKFFSGKISFESSEFCEKLFKFDSISIELKYPEESFDYVYNQFLNLKRIELKRINISIFITGINETDMKFRSDKNINSVIIDSPVTKISGGNLNFYETGGGSFKNCSSLTTVIISNSVSIIGQCSFQKCSSLKEITIPSSVTSIEEYAFFECSSLTRVVLPSSIKSISNFVFNECSSLIQINIPSSVISIGCYAFNNCSSLRQINIPSSVSIIGLGAFCKCSSLEQVTIPSSVSVIDQCVFEDCSSLAQVSIPSSVIEIKGGAFRRCSSLTQVVIPSSVKEIGIAPFFGCTSLNQITIPSSLNTENIRIDHEVRIIRI